VGLLAWDDGQCPKCKLRFLPLHLTIRKVSAIACRQSAAVSNYQQLSSEKCLMFRPYRPRNLDKCGRNLERISFLYFFGIFYILIVMDFVAFRTFFLALQTIAYSYRKLNFSRRFIQVESVNMFQILIQIRTQCRCWFIVEDVCTCACSKDKKPNRNKTVASFDRRMAF
jgi:hypothetical protein